MSACLLSGFNLHALDRLIEDEAPDMEWDGDEEQKSATASPPKPMAANPRARIRTSSIG